MKCAARSTLVHLALAVFVLVLFDRAARGDKAPATRPRLGLAGTWRMQFVKGPGTPPQANGKWTERKLPHGTYYRCIRFPLPDKNKDVASKQKLPDGLWLERSVTVPPEWKGRRVVLHIGKLMYGCKVVADGKPMGQILWHGGAVDITEGVSFEKPTTLRLFFGRGGKGIDGLGPVAAAAVEAFRSHPRWNKGSYFAGVDCLPDEFYLESRPSGPMVTDVWYRTYTRGYVHVDPRVTIESPEPVNNVKLVVTLYEPTTGKPLRRGELIIDHLPAGTSEHELVIKSNGKLKRWSIGRPELTLGQAVLSGADGKELDRSDVVRFGVREVYLQGRQVMLDGNPVAMISYFWSDDPPPGATLLYEHPDTGRHITTNQEAAARFCDEKGYGFLAFGVPIHDVQLSDEAMLLDYRRSVRRHLRRLRNHPSVLMYGLAMNRGGGWQYFNPETIGTSAMVNWRHVEGTAATLVHHEVDPTRPVYFHGANPLGDLDSANIYFNFTPEQEVVDWLERWSKHGDRPLLVNEFMGGPLGVDYQKDLVSYVTEYLAMTRGDEAYRTEPDHLVDYTVYEVPRLTSHWQYHPFNYSELALQEARRRRPRTTRAWRWYGATVHPWVFPPKGPRKTDAETPVKGAEEIWKLGLETMAPKLAWIGGPSDEVTRTDVRVTGGRTIERSLVVVRDLPDPGRWTWQWQATLGGKPLPTSPRAGEAELLPWDRRCVPVRLDVPEVEQPTELTLSVTVKGMDTKPVATDRAVVMVYPRGWATDTGSKVKPYVDIIDPVGDTTRLLAEVGASTSPWRPGGGRPWVLVIGRGALQGVTELPFTAEQVARGTRVVIFEQHSAVLEKLGLRVEDCAPRRAFVRMAEHPVLRGIDDAKLAYWRGDGTLVPPGPGRDRVAVSRRLFRSSNRAAVASVIPELPDAGPFMPLVVTGFDLDYAPLMRWRHGAGEVIFCQLDVTGRTDRDPAARRIVRNLVEYLAGPVAGPAQDRVAVVMSKPAAARLSTLGFAAVAMETVKDLSPDRHVVVLTRHDHGAVAPVKQKLDRFASVGGTVLVFNTDAAMVKHLGLDGKVTVHPTPRVRATRTVEDHPLLRGVGPNVVHWREPVTVNLLQSDKDDATTLLDGVVLELTRGRGRYVFVQVDETTMDDYQTVEALERERSKDKAIKPVPRDRRRRNRERAVRHVDRLCATALTNLHVGSAPELIERLFTVRQAVPVVPVNEWWYVGPFFTDKPDDDPLALDLSAWLDKPDAKKTGRNTRGEPVRWYRPTDANNGLGSGGKMPLTQVYGTRVKAVVAARTWVWSTRARTARLNLGADWWMRVSVNGKEVFRTVADKQKKIWTFGHEFSHKGIRVPLKQGWNRLTCVVASGSSSHAFWFAMSDPGDLVVSQSVTRPDAPPKDLPDVEALATESDEPVYGLYRTEVTPENDPYRFYAW